MSQLKWNLLIILAFCGVGAEGVVAISPLEVASVCNGGQLEVTCTTTESFLRWNITLDQEAMTTGSDTFARTLSSFGSTSEVSPLTINSSMFTFIRTSTEGHVPLMSTLLINPVTRMLNRTTVTCMQISSPGSSTTILHIIDNDYYTNEVNINSISEQFEREGVTVTVTLEWTQDSSLVSFNISVFPQVAIHFNGSVSAQLMVPYNTAHNVSISAAVFCGLSSTTYIVLSYANCGSPQTQNNESITAIGLIDDLALEGTNITFNCRPGLALTGPNLSTCMGNGEWEPDPREVRCKAFSNCGPPMSPLNGFISPYTSTTEGVRVTFACQNICHIGIQTSSDELHSAVCTTHGQWEPEPHTFCSKVEESTSTCDRATIAVVSSVTVFLSTSIIMLIIGFACGHYFGQQSIKSSGQEQTSNRDTHQPIAHTEPQEQGLELTENISYEPSRLNFLT